MRIGLRSALCLTLSRVVLGPLFIATYFWHERLGITKLGLPFFLLALLALSELSDIFDGIVARKTNQVTDLGKLLDPMADSIFRTSVFFAFTGGFVKLPLLLVILFFYRDCLISTLRTLCALKGVALAARMSGKIKAVLQALSALFIIILMIPYSRGAISEETFQNWSFYSVAIAVVYSLLSGVEYIVANKAYIKRALKLA